MNEPMREDVGARLELWAQRALEFKKSLGPFADAIIARTEQGLFAVDPEDAVIAASLLHNGSWSIAEVNRLQQFLSPESRVLIVGAHIGTLLIPLSKCCREVVAFEPNPRSYYLLSINLKLNDVRNCQVHNLAASNQSEKLQFLLNRTNSGGSKRVPLARDIKYYYDRPEEVEIHAVALDSHLINKRFDLIVMDTEGSEYFALQGMQQILAQCKVLQMEFIPHHLTDVAGIEVPQLIAQVRPHFSRLIIPSQSVAVGQENFEKVLQHMFKNGITEDGLIFQK